jgi:hypothetical protein
MSDLDGRPLKTDDAMCLFLRLKPQAKNVLVAFNDGLFDQGIEGARMLHEMVTAARSANLLQDDDYLNDLFVLDVYIELLTKYGELWQNIIEQRFSDSWCSLQDALDRLRLIKAFSRINIGFFEEQLTELQSAYPYKVFISAGMLVDQFNCSICGVDIDSDDCPHVRGSLYRGVMAYGVAQNIVALDHIALVTDPDDKRCVVQYDDRSEHFTLVRLLGELVASKKWQLSDFARLHHTTKSIPNPEYSRVGRNDPCICGSGQKFKKCCIAKTTICIPHVDLVAVPRSIDTALL